MVNNHRTEIEEKEDSQTVWPTVTIIKNDEFDNKQTKKMDADLYNHAFFKIAKHILCQAKILFTK